MTIEMVGGLVVVLVIYWFFTAAFMGKMAKDLLKIKDLLEALADYELDKAVVWEQGERVKEFSTWKALAMWLKYSRDERKAK